MHCSDGAVLVLDGERLTITQNRGSRLKAVARGHDDKPTVCDLMRSEREDAAPRGV